MNTPPANTGDLRSRVQQALAAEIGPALDMDGSRIDIVAVHDGEVQLRLNGVCGNCPSSIMAVVMGIEQELCRLVPEVRYVEILP
jgi:Fe-S cluster biogenesis protein NfuA